MPFNADYHVECVLPRGLLSVPVYQLEVDVYVVGIFLFIQLKPY